MEQTDYSRFLDLFEQLVKAHKKDVTAALTKSQPTPFDVYNYLWKSYELELSHFWQRAIFLTVFLAGIAGAYGVYIKDVFIPNFDNFELLMPNKNQSSSPAAYPTQILSQSFTSSGMQNIHVSQSMIEKDIKEKVSLRLIAVIPIFLCVLGLIFSYLWIAMMKGSKAWYELYEDSIAKVSGYDDFTGLFDNRFWNDSSFRKVFGEDSCPQQYRFGCMDYKETKGDNCIFSTKRGLFSPSKINSMIGIISFCTFTLLCGWHILCCLWYSFQYKILYFIVLCSAVACIILVYLVPKQIISSFLAEKIKE